MSEGPRADQGTGGKGSTRRPSVRENLSYVGPIKPKIFATKNGLMLISSNVVYRSFSFCWK